MTVEKQSRKHQNKYKYKYERINPYNPDKLSRWRAQAREGENEREREWYTCVQVYQFSFMDHLELLSIALVAAECFPSGSIVVVAAAELVPVILLDWLLNTF